MKHWLKKFLLLLYKPRLIPMTEEEEWQIYRMLKDVSGFRDLLELKMQAALVLYADTNDKKYLGYREFCMDLLEKMIRANEEKPTKPMPTSGYSSTI